jgi:hypothetical protein
MLDCVWSVSIEALKNLWLSQLVGLELTAFIPHTCELPPCIYIIYSSEAGLIDVSGHLYETESSHIMRLSF